MSVVALLLVLASALIHATWNLAAKKGGASVAFAFQSALAVAITWAPINVIFAYLNTKESPAHWDGVAWAFAFLSAVIHAVYFVCLLHGYKVAPLSLVYPVARGTGPLVSATIAIALFNEPLSASVIIGITMITGRVVLLTTTGTRDRSDSAAVQRGLRWGALTGLLIALYTVVDAYAVKALKLNPIPFDYCVSVLRAVILFPFVVRVLPTASWTGPVGRAIAVVATLSPLAYILVLSAMQLAPLSHVAPARELSLMIGAFFGGSILKEGYAAKRVTAAGLIAAGVTMLSL